MLRIASAGLVGLVVTTLCLAACGNSDDGGEGASGGSSGTATGSSGASASGGAASTSGGAGSSGSGTGSSWSTPARDGTATFYAATGAGNCSFDASPNDLNVAALGNDTYDTAAMCGGCIEVVGPKGTVTVRAVDRCPECEATHLDLAKEAFVQIADEKDGLVAVSFRFVACQTKAKMKYRYKSGSSQYWTAIQVIGHDLPIAKLETQKDGAWVAASRQIYNYFVTAGGVGVQPNGVPVRLTAIDGQVVTDTLPPVGEDPPDTNLHDGTAQFE